jgi:hypothetical protein
MKGGHHAESFGLDRVKDWFGSNNVISVSELLGV